MLRDGMVFIHSPFYDESAIECHNGVVVSTNETESSRSRSNVAPVNRTTCQVSVQLFQRTIRARLNLAGTTARAPRCRAVISATVGPAGRAARVKPVSTTIAFKPAFRGWSSGGDKVAAV